MSTRVAAEHAIRDVPGGFVAFGRSRSASSALSGPYINTANGRGLIFTAQIEE